MTGYGSRHGQKRQAAHDARAQGPHEGVAARQREDDAGLGHGVDGGMADGRRQAAAGTFGDVREEDPADDAEHAHGGDAGKRPARIAHAVVVPKRGQGRMPHAPDDAGNQERRHDVQAACHLRHQIPSPAPFLAEGRHDVDDASQHDGDGQGQVL